VKESQIRTAYLSLVWIRDYFYLEGMFFAVDMVRLIDWLKDWLWIVFLFDMIDK
jgi:hypothetical protein